MSKEKTLEDVIGFLMNVAEFDLAKTKRAPIPGGAMTVVSENYQYMYEVIEWIEAKIKEPKFNVYQEIALWAMQNRFKLHASDIESGLLEYLTTVSDEVYLSNKEFAEVLQAFAAWVLDQC